MRSHLYQGRSGQAALIYLSRAKKNISLPPSLELLPLQSPQQQSAEQTQLLLQPEEALTAWGLIKPPGEAEFRIMGLGKH